MSIRDFFTKLTPTFRDLPFNRKMLLCFFLTVVLPLGVILPIFYFYQHTTIEEEINRVNMEHSEQTAEQLNILYNQIDSVSNLYFLNEDIESILRTGYIYDHIQMEADQEKILRLQQLYNTTVEQIDLHLTIISNDGRIYGDGVYNTKVPLSEEENCWWYQSLLQSPWQTLWIRDSYLDELHSIQDSHYIYSVRLLKRFDTWADQGLLIVSFLESDLIKLYANSVPASGSMFILDQDGNVISMVDHAGLAQKFSASVLRDGYSASYIEDIEGTQYQVACNTVSKPQWRVAVLTPIRQLYKQFQDFTLLLTILVVTVLLSFTLFLYMMSHLVVKPLCALTDDIREIGMAGTLSKRVSVYSKDEIGILSAEFDKMLERVEELMHTVIEEQSAKRKAELQSLYAQINPHFIYNTLTSIRFLIISGENSRADSALHSFIHLLRDSISTENELCTIQFEIDLLKEYINIQQIFFETPFQVTWDIAPELLNCKIIKLSLQPIVENAVMHGLKAKAGDKRLLIQIRPKRNGILITIADNGVGTNRRFSFDHVKSDFSKNIGMMNVHSRTVLHFGKPYGLTFSSSPGQGATICLYIPRIQDREEFM